MLKYENILTSNKRNVPTFHESIIKYIICAVTAIISVLLVLVLVWLKVDTKKLSNGLKFVTEACEMT